MFLWLLKKLPDLLRCIDIPVGTPQQKRPMHGRMRHAVAAALDRADAAGFARRSPANSAQQGNLRLKVAPPGMSFCSDEAGRRFYERSVIHAVSVSRSSAMTSASLRPLRAGTWKEWSASLKRASVAR